jgi:dynein heavy chain
MVCERALNNFVFRKKIVFPRFFFVSQTDLLDILSNGNVPTKVMKHMSKIFGAIKTLELIEEGVRPAVVGMEACVGKEFVKFTRELKLLGKVEVYLQWVIDVMRGSLKDITLEKFKLMGNEDKLQWITNSPSQVVLLLNNCQWVINCEKAFINFQGGDKDAMQKCYD